MIKTAELDGYPTEHALADWRRQICDLYSQIRSMDDPHRAWQKWHAVRNTLFKFHAMSPIDIEERADFKSIPVFDYDPDLRFTVGVVPKAGDLSNIDVGNDGTLAIRSFATTDGLEAALGKELTLYWITGYGGGMFLPFRDASSKSETYGGGRYLIDSIKGPDLGLKDGKLIIDFNFAYNPSCALNPSYVCPLSPPENSMDIKILAGEKIPD